MVVMPVAPMIHIQYRPGVCSFAHTWGVLACDDVRQSLCLTSLHASIPHVRANEQTPGLYMNVNHGCHMTRLGDEQ